MRTIAYRIGWDGARLKVEKESPQYDPNFDPNRFVQEYSHLFTVNEMDSCLKGVTDYLQYKIEADAKEKEEEERRMEILDRIAKVRENKRQNSFLFYIALVLGHHHNGD